MIPHILRLVGDWNDIFHKTYCRVDSSQCTDLKLVSLQRGGIRLHGSVVNMSRGKKIPPAVRASVHLLSGHARMSQIKKEDFSVRKRRNFECKNYGLPLSLRVCEYTHTNTLEWKCQRNFISKIQCLVI